MKKKTVLLLTLSLLCQSFSAIPTQAEENDFEKTTLETATTISSSDSEPSLSDSSTSSTSQTSVTSNSTSTTVTKETNSTTDSLTTQESIQPQRSIPSPINKYGVILQKGTLLWNSVEAIEENKQPEDAWSDIYVNNRNLFHVTEEISVSEKNYYHLVDDLESLSFYIEKEAVSTLRDNPWVLDDSFNAPKYLTITSTQWTIYNDLNLSSNFSSQNILNKSYKITARYRQMDNKMYLELSDDSNKIGYLEEDVVKDLLVDKSEIKSYQKYVQVKENKQAFTDLEKLSSNHSFSTQELQKQTFFAKEIYQDKFVALYDNNDTLKGYVNKSDIIEADGKQGKFHPYKKLITITKNSDTWNNFNWETRKQKKSILNNTYSTKGIYYHFNGKNYLSVYDSKDHWLGYIDKDNTKVVQNKQGNYHKYGKFVTITNKNIALWKSFTWEKKNSSTNLYNKTLQAKGIYHHYNGSNYLSLYDKKGKWQGYINEKATSIGKGEQGAYRNFGKYVTLTKKNYTIWKDFNGHVKNSSSNLIDKTFEAKGIYYHYKDYKYLSLYDIHGKWIGYINQNATKIANGKQGIYHSYGKTVKISSNNAIWKNFSWSKRAAGKHKNKFYIAKGIYHHMNGSSYLSLYNGNKWVGYINQKGTTSATGVANYMGTSRQKVLNSLTKDEKAPKKKKRYLGTPFGGFSVMNPQRYSNCTGFVALAMRDSGGKLNKITNVANAYGGPANAYNWRDALKKNTSYYTFNSISQLLKSGKARKGDIIYFEADFSKPNPDCHIGFFWGNSSSDNRMWHSTVAGGGNNITHIFTGTPYTKVYLFPMD